MSIYDNSPSQVWFISHVASQEKESKYFKSYKKFFIKQLKENKIEIVYTVEPLTGDDDVLKDILNKECINKTQVTEILISHLLLTCDDLKN